MHLRRRRLSLADVIVRYLAWLCLLLSLWPVLSGAAGAAAVPVVTNIAGAVELRSSKGSSRDIVSSQIVRDGDRLMTGINSLAVVQLADVGRVRLGPGTTTTAATNGTSLTFKIASGSMCVESDHPAITIQSGALVVSAAADGTIFDLLRDAGSTKLAVYQGQVSTKLGNKNPTTLKSGDAVVSSHDGAPEAVPLQTLTTAFTALHCPDDAVIAQALAPPSPPPAASGGGGGGAGILGILLGVAGLAALAGSHGGGGGGGGGGSPLPSILPSPSPSPGALMVSTNSLSFSATGGTHNQTFMATESNYTAAINAVSDNPDVATVSPATGNGPSVTFTVTPIAQGTAHITITDSHSGSQTVTATVQLPPGPLSASPSSMLFTHLGAGHSQQLTGSESNYSGPINAVSDTPGVASVAPASGSGPSVNFTVTPVSAGTAHITLTDNHSGQVIVTVNVAPPGSLGVNPSALTFNSAGAANQSFTATESNYNGQIFTSGCSGIATVSPGTGSGPSQQFSVNPQAAGSCTIIVTDDHGGTQNVAVTVFGSLTVAPGSMTFNNTNAKDLTISETAYPGQFTTSGCSGIVSINPSIGNGPSATLSVSPVSSGSCTITVSDDHGNSKNVNVTVNAGTLSANPGSLTFTSASAGSQPFTASETNFTGSFTVTGCSGIVSVSPNPGTGPSQIFNVSPSAEGTCNLSISDGSNTVMVAITVFGAISLSPNSLSFNGTTTSQTLTAQENFYGGPFTIHDPTCSGVVTVTGGGNGPTQHYTVTPVAVGSCSVTVQDNHGGNDTSTITVSAGSIGVAPSTLTFNNASAASQNVTATETNYTGPFTPSGCSGVVSVSPASGTGPSQVFSVSPVAPGSCTLMISDNHSGSGSVTVTVFGALQLSPGSLSFTDVGAGHTQPFTINEPFFTGTFTVNASACGGIASRNAGPFTGPSANVTVTAIDSGSCMIAVTDGHGGNQPESITVGPFGPVSPSQNSFSLVVGGVNGSLTVSETNYTGTFSTSAPGCSGIASISPGSGTSFTITPSGAGACAIIISDDHGQQAQVNVFVTTGSMTVSPSSLQLANVGDSANFTATTGAPGATITATSSDTTVATVLPPSGPAPSQTFTVTAVANGRTTITVDDGMGGTAVVAIGVGMSPLLKSRHPIALHKPLPKHGPTQTPPPRQKYPIVSRPLRPLNPQAAPQSNPFGNPGGIGNMKRLPVGALTTGSLNLVFTNVRSPQALAIFEMNYSGAFTAVTTNPNVATVSTFAGRGPSAWLTVTPHNPGTTVIRVMDDHGGVRDIFITVQPPAMSAPPGARPPTLPGHPPTHQ